MSTSPKSHSHGHGTIPLEHVVHFPKKRTIIKDRVGCTRTTTYDLPPDGFSYGRKSAEGIEGAGDLISNWVTANPSLEKKSQKQIVYSNVLAIKRGCITAKSMRQYGIDHPNIRMKEILNTDSTRVDGLHEGPFGIKTRFADERIEELLGAKFTDYRNDDADYPSVQTIQKKGFMPVPKSTIASQSIVEARLKREHVPEHHRFIMKRFQHIKGTFEREREEAKARDTAASKASNGDE